MSLQDAEVGDHDVLLQTHARAPQGWARAVLALIAGAGVIAVAGFSGGLQRPQLAKVAVKGHFAGLASDNHEFKHMSGKCVAALEKLEKDAEANGTDHEG